MLRAERANDWTAEQHEAAAAALGSFTASLMRIGPTGSPGMDTMQALIARWSAQDAASHAFAAMLEHDKIAAALDRELPIVVLCSWCGAVRTQGDPPVWGRSDLPLTDAVRVSHGCCPACVARQEA